MQGADGGPRRRGRGESGRRSRAARSRRTVSVVTSYPERQLGHGGAPSREDLRGNRLLTFLGVHGSPHVSDAQLFWICKCVGIAVSICWYLLLYARTCCFVNHLCNVLHMNASMVLVTEFRLCRACVCAGRPAGSASFAGRTAFGR